MFSRQHVNDASRGTRNGQVQDRARIFNAIMSHGLHTWYVGAIARHD